MYTTGDKLLNVMKEEEIGIAELARISGVPERTILDIMAGVKEPELGVIIETTKTDAGTRVLPITEDVAQMFQAIIEDRNAPKVEKAIDRYSGFLFCDDNGMPLVAMHWHIVSIIWLADTMTFTGCRCQILHLMYADTPIVRIWQNRE